MVLSERRPALSALLLHACCAPCSLEPVRLLQEQGHRPVLFFANSNIHPVEEYERRLSALKQWTSAERIELIVAPYDPDRWMKFVAEPFFEHQNRTVRCRACYRFRLQETAQVAKERGFNAIATTLSVSPYQDHRAIEEELVTAADNEELEARYADYRPYYPAATQRSRTLGLYRQRYCGCFPSRQEAEAQREARRVVRQAQRERKRIAEAPQRAAQEAQLHLKRAERQAYEAKQQAKRAAKKAWREAHRASR